MLNQVIVFFGSWWNTRAKEALSRFFYGKSAWKVSAIEALSKKNIFICGCRDPQEISDQLRGKLFYKPDWLGGLLDSSKPPEVLTREGGGDCEDFALIHALAIKEVLKWKAYYGVYITRPTSKSHSFAVAYSPNGDLWILDPQPTEELLKKDPTYQNVHYMGQDTIESVLPNIPGILWNMIMEV